LIYDAHIIVHYSNKLLIIQRINLIIILIGSDLLFALHFSARSNTLCYILCTTFIDTNARNEIFIKNYFLY